MLKKNTENESDNLHLGNIPSTWTGVDLFNWLKFEDKISPPIRRLLGYDTDFAKDLGMVWEGLGTYEDLMFLYINRDIWGLNPYA